MISSGIVRRDFLAALGSALAWPAGAWAQQLAAPVVGCLINGMANDSQPLVEPFRDGLGDAGFVEGDNVRIEYRWAEGRNERLVPLAAELVGLRVDVLATL